MSGIGRAALATAAAATATFAVDRASKLAVEHSLAPGERARGPLGLPLVRRTNRQGVAGSGAGSRPDALLIVGGSALALGIAGAGAKLGRSLPAQLGAGMVAGAMLGNLVDRARGDGGVTDFLATPVGVVNAADVLLGAGLVVGGIGLVLR